MCDFERIITGVVLLSTTCLRFFENTPAKRRFLAKTNGFWPTKPATNIHLMELSARTRVDFLWVMAGENGVQRMDATKLQEIAHRFGRRLRLCGSGALWSQSRRHEANDDEFGRRLGPTRSHR